ncbi:unnamed protein product [Closterium sp. Yama58-4]|nr:unnamed protein product [Closterium sp. Yama58-4]
MSSCAKCAAPAGELSSARKERHIPQSVHPASSGSLCASAPPTPPSSRVVLPSAPHTCFSPSPLPKALRISGNPAPPPLPAYHVRHMEHFSPLSCPRTYKTLPNPNPSRSPGGILPFRGAHLMADQVESSSPLHGGQGSHDPSNPSLNGGTPGASLPMSIPAAPASIAIEPDGFPATSLSPPAGRILNAGAASMSPSMAPSMAPFNVPHMGQGLPAPMGYGPPGMGAQGMYGHPGGGGGGGGGYMHSGSPVEASPLMPIAAGPRRQARGHGGHAHGHAHGHGGHPHAHGHMGGMMGGPHHGGGVGMGMAMGMGMGVPMGMPPAGMMAAADREGVVVMQSGSPQMAPQMPAQMPAHLPAQMPLPAVEPAEAAGNELPHEVVAAGTNGVADASPSAAEAAGAGDVESAAHSGNGAAEAGGSEGAEAKAEVEAGGEGASFFFPLHCSPPSPPPATWDVPSSAVGTDSVLVPHSNNLPPSLCPSVSPPRLPLPFVCLPSSSVSPRPSVPPPRPSVLPGMGHGAWGTWRQVEFYLSDQNLPTDNHLMKLVRKDPDGYVPLKIIAEFRKIRALVPQGSPNVAVVNLLAVALRASPFLVVGEDGKKVRRAVPLGEVDLEEVQGRTVVAENLPEDHSIPAMEALFAKAGKVKMVRVCKPEAANSANQAATAAAAAAGAGGGAGGGNSGRHGHKQHAHHHDLVVTNKLHALVEYESVEEAERAVEMLTDENNWRSGLHVRLLIRKPAHVPCRHSLPLATVSFPCLTVSRAAAAPARAGL